MNSGFISIDVYEDRKITISQENLKPSEIIATLVNVYVNACKQSNYTPKDINKLTDVVIREKYQIPITKISKRGKKKK